MTARLKNYLAFYSEKLSDLCKSWFECHEYLQGMALSPNIQVRTRYMHRMAGVSQVSFILSRHSSLMLNRIENLGLQAPLVGGTGQLLLALISKGL